MVSKLFMLTRDRNLHAGSGAAVHDYPQNYVDEMTHKIHPLKHNERN
jgi:hypothetical protein